MKKKLWFYMLLGAAIALVAQYGVGKLAKYNEQQEVSAFLNSYSKAGDKSSFIRNYLESKTGLSVEIATGKAGEDYAEKCDSAWRNYNGLVKMILDIAEHYGYIERGEDSAYGGMLETLFNELTYIERLIDIYCYYE